MPLKKRIEKIVKTNRVAQTLYVCLGSLFVRFLGLFIKQDPDLILFSSFGGDSLNDSPRAIYDYVKRHYPRYECVWAVNKKGLAKVADEKHIQIDSLRYFCLANKAHYWVTNVNIERGLHFKKRGTFYLNTWHGTPIKTIGNSVKGRKDYNFKNVDFLCSDGPFMSEIFVRCFNALPEHIYECGRPREDLLYKPNRDDIACSVREKLGIPLSNKVVFYAPTWKETSTVSFLETESGLADLAKALGKEVTVVFRAHHLSEGYQKNLAEGQVVDASNWPDINELYLIADVLVSDYSSCFFDYAILGRPFFCFAQDYDEYRQSRGFTFDLRSEFPGGVIEDEHVLVDRILHCLKNPTISEEQETFCSKYVRRQNGDATEFCCLKMLGEPHE